MSFIAGHYAATWNGTSIGTTREGFHLKETLHDEHILTDDGGDAPVDGVQRGTECMITLDYVEYDSIKPALYAQTGTPGDVMTNVGKLLTTLAKSLVLTAKAGTSAATVVGAIATLTATKAIVVSDIDTLMASKLRQGPITLRLLPDSASANKAYTTT